MLKHTFYQSNLITQSKCIFIPLAMNMKIMYKVLVVIYSIYRLFDFSMLAWSHYLL